MEDNRTQFDVYELVGRELDKGEYLPLGNAWRDSQWGECFVVALRALRLFDDKNGE